jgi:hypothetical protein
MGAYRGYPPNFLDIVRRLSPISAHNLGPSLRVGPRRNTKALKYIIIADEGIRDTPVIYTPIRNMPAKGARIS